MSLSERLEENVRACFAGIWIRSNEHEDAVMEIANLCREQEWRYATWDIDQGLRVAGQSIDDGISDPLTAVRSAQSIGEDETPSLLVLVNFHRFLGSAEITQAMARQINEGKNRRTFLVVLSPVVQVPSELEKLFVSIEHELPSRDQLEEIARGVATEAGELPIGDELDKLLDAACGLTRYEAEGAFSLSLVRHSRVVASTIWDLKSKTLTNSGLLSLYRDSADFSSLGGMSALKEFCQRALRQPCRENPLKRARGVLLLSPPGCGKSQFAKTLGAEVGRPVLILDVGGLMGSLVGQSEERTRRALKIVDAMAPCVLMIDEVEKAFAGAGGNGDSGVTSRMFGAFLSWLNDHTSDVFVICTSNDISKLPPEFGRSERFDSIFYLDLPSRDEKDVIWDLYLDVFELNRKQPLADDDMWTGAEIKACCRLAALLDLSLEDAAKNVVPIAVTAAESVERLRTWANGRCLSADQPGVYRYAKPQNATTRRRLPRDPGLN